MQETSKRKPPSARSCSVESTSVNAREKVSEEEGPAPKRICLEAGDTNHLQNEDSPTGIQLKNELNKSHQTIYSLKKKLKVSQQKSRRLKTKVKSLKTVVKQLREKHLISSSCEEMLQRSFSGVPLALLKRMTSAKKSGKGLKYSPELKSFALTLQFYSSKAYEFVRKTFNLALPHQAQIRKWYGKVHAEPGFTEPAFTALAAKVEEAKQKGQTVPCSLMLDEMAIRKHISWDGKKMRGYVDLGNDVEEDDSAPVAADALVFMVVSVNDCWKVPCGYFLIDGLSGAERANLVKVCIQRLYDAGVDVVSLTCDGPSCHFTMLKNLGASLKPESLQAHFAHPIDPNKKIHIFLDVCHMLKLVRNTLGTGGILVDKDGNKVCWQYLSALQKLQDEEGLRLGNKLKLAHIRWQQQKMKVNLAAQTFSSSVADAMEYCCNVLKLTQFQGCEATVKFIRLFDRLFDILNSRNPCAGGYKSALRVSNKKFWNPFLDEAFSYILSLKDPSGIPMHATRRKTGFVGFLVAIKSIKGIFYDLVEQPQAPLKYLLAYKFSQDHLELFFGAIRSAGGFNNNPTAQQFTAAYKRLLMRSSIQAGKGNCQIRDPTAILHVIGDTCNINDQSVTISDAALIRKYDLSERKPIQHDHDYSDAPNIANLSEYKKAAISYIAGYVAKMADKKILCLPCCKALGSRKHIAQSAFLKLKDRGELFKPTESVIKICQETEKCFQRMLTKTGGKLPHCKGIPDAIASSVLAGINLSEVFRELDNHMMDTSVFENHVFGLIKIIAKCYCKVRLYHLGKEATDKISSEKVRKKLNKLVLFKHQ